MCANCKLAAAFEDKFYTPNKNEYGDVVLCAADLNSNTQEGPRRPLECSGTHCHPSHHVGECHLAYAQSKRFGAPPREHTC